MTNEIQIFKFNDHPVRVVEKDGEPWWVAKDVCDILELGNPRTSLALLEEDEKNTVHIMDGNRGNPETTIISEPGLFRLILRSRKPQAKAFQRWAVHEVFPAIRKTGAYIPEGFKVPQTFSEALRLAANLEDQRAALAAKIEADKPKVDFYHAVGATDNDIIVRDMAKLLCQNGFDIGEKRLFAQLREKGFLIKAKPDWNRPTQRAMELGLFRVQEKVLYNEIGNPSRTVFTTKITPKGQQYFLKAFQDGTF